MQEDDQELGTLVAQAIGQSRLTMRELAEEAGFSHQTLRSWASGRRSPNRKSALQLAEALRRRSGQLQELAAKIEDAAAEEG